MGYHDHTWSAGRDGLGNPEVCLWAGIGLNVVSRKFNKTQQSAKLTNVPSILNRTLQLCKVVRCRKFSLSSCLEDVAFSKSLIKGVEQLPWSAMAYKQSICYLP